MRAVIALCLCALASAAEQGARWRPLGAQADVPLSAEFAERLATIIAAPGRAWTGTGGLAVAPRGIITVDGRSFAYYGFLVDERSVQAWDDPALRAFWEELNRSPSPEALRAWAPPP